MDNLKDMDNLIDFNTSPVQDAKSRKIPKSTLNQFNSFLDEFEDFNHNSKECGKLLNNPIETYLIKSSESKPAATKGELLNIFNEANDSKTLANQLNIISNCIPGRSNNFEVEYFNTSNEQCVEMPEKSTLEFYNSSLSNIDGKHLNQVKHSSNLENKPTEELLIDFEEKSTTLGDYHTVTNKCSLNIDKNASRGKFNKIDMKNQLLKLSLSNALIQSPTTRKNSLENETISEGHILNEAAKLAKKLSQTHLSSPDSSSKERSDDSCEDLMQIDPKWVDSMSENDISKDLELLKIPMLDKISEDLKKKEMVVATEVSFVKQDVEKFDINVLKEKLKCKENQVAAENVDQLILSLKNYVTHSETNFEKQSEAQKLLDSLSCLLKHESSNDKNEIMETAEIANSDLRPRKTIVRQATFNYDSNSQIGESKVEEEREVCDLEIQTGKEEHKNVRSDSPIEINQMVKQISKLLGQNENVNVLRSEFNNSVTSLSSKPTVIVVMASPNQKEFRRRSCSLTLPDKKNSRLLKNDNHTLHSKENINQAGEYNSFKTPTRSYLNRRNSLSSVTPHNDFKNSTVRRSIYGSNNSNNKQSSENGKTLNNTPIKSKINSNEDSKNFETKYIPLKTDINMKRLRVKSGENLPVKGPIKATFQINTVKSNMNVLHSTPVQNCNIRRKSVFGTNSFSLSTGNYITKNAPIACSTPMHLSPTNSPSNKRTSTQRLPVIPNSKSQSNFLNVSSNFCKNRRNSFAGSSKVTGKQKAIVQTSQRTKVTLEGPKTINRLKLPSTPTRFTAVKKENIDPKK